MTELKPTVEARIVNWTPKLPTDVRRTAARDVARKLGTIARTWKKHGIQPYRSRCTVPQARQSDDALGLPGPERRIRSPGLASIKTSRSS